jgi:hypothetical protein
MGFTFEVEGIVPRSVDCTRRPNAFLQPEFSGLWPPDSLEPSRSPWGAWRVSSLGGLEGHTRFKSPCGPSCHGNLDRSRVSLSFSDSTVFSPIRKIKGNRRRSVGYHSCSRFYTGVPMPYYHVRFG